MKNHLFNDFIYIEENIEQSNYVISKEFFKDFKLNDDEEFEDEGNYNIFKRKLKDLKQKIIAINSMISIYKDQDYYSLKKKAYLQEILNNLKEIASSIDII